MDGSQFVSPPLADIGLSLGKRRSLPVRKLLIGGAAFLLLIGAVAYGRYYWTVGRFLVSTDDATVQADSVIISPKVSGYIAAVPVEDNQPVHAGDTLARIDDRTIAPLSPPPRPMCKPRRPALRISSSRSNRSTSW